MDQVIKILIEALLTCAFSAVFFLIIYLIFFRKAEIKAKKYRETMKIGDSIYFHPTINCDGVITDIDTNGDDKFVTITTVIPKHFIFPKNK